MSILPAQSRAARALIGWSQTQLAEAAGIARATLAEFEGGKRQPIANNLSALRIALESAGVMLIDADANGPGVRLRDPI